jgi:diguanylate cyclase (GGDEF)-like protein
VSDGSKLARLDQENAALRRAISVLHRVANLVRDSLELEATCYAVLTGVTAGVGLGMNRAMLFLSHPDDADPAGLYGRMAVGPATAEEADRVWRSIAADAPDLETLYQVGLKLRDARRAGEQEGALDEVVRGLRVSLDGESPIARAMRERRTVLGGGADDLDGLLSLRTCIAAPLEGRDGLQGVLYADNRFTRTTPDPIVEMIFGLVADHAARAIDNARRYEREARRARTDALTGLGHHGALMEALDEAVREARSDGAPLSLAMIDLDDFKKVNDTFGHLSGDALLVALADRLRACVRAKSSVYRYGGEEFALILSGADLAAAEQVGERVRHAVGCEPFVLEGNQILEVRCSVGVAALDGHPSARELLADADRALLEAKSAGKDRVVRAS